MRPQLTVTSFHGLRTDSSDKNLGRRTIVSRRAARVGRATHRGKSARSEASRPSERLKDSRG